MSRGPSDGPHGIPPCGDSLPGERRMVGPPIRPEPGTPHSTRIPKGTGYGRENVTVSHAPPGTIADRCGCQDQELRQGPVTRIRAHADRGVAVVGLPCPTRRRMVGPPIRPKPATPHIALIPKGIGYGRENVTVSHAPPGTITKRSGYPEARTPAPSTRPASPSFRMLIARSFPGAQRPGRLLTEIVGRTNRPATRPGGAWWGLPSGRSRQPHIAR